MAIKVSKNVAANSAGLRGHLFKFYQVCSCFSILSWKVDFVKLFTLYKLYSNVLANGTT